MTGYETVIGLEVHVQLGVRTKLFSAAPAGFAGEPNTRVAAYDIGLPGVLPVLNDRAVDLAIRAAASLDGSVQSTSRFDRKNYFYPDLPKGYQISQFAEPYCRGGRVPLGDGRYGQLDRIHLEEDAGKSTHIDAATRIDLNRAGSALIEVVGKPDLRAPAEASAWLQSLRSILRFAGVSDCDMEKGSMRCDANVSIRPAGSDVLGNKVEIKNLNSFKMVERALEYEVRRQTVTLSAGHTVVQETRLWNDEKAETRSMRTKEDAQDYRYVPDPDVPPLLIDEDRLRRVLAEMPESYAEKTTRYQRDLGLPEYDVGVLLAEPANAAYFEALLAEGGYSAKAASNWLMTEVMRSCNDSGVGVESFPMTTGHLAGLIRAAEAGTVNMQGARKAFAHMLDTGVDSARAIADLGIAAVRDEDELAQHVDAAIAELPKAVADVAAGKAKALHAIKGRVMAKTKGRADPEQVERMLAERLEPTDRG